jgi:hypothetical protein
MRIHILIKLAKPWHVCSLLVGHVGLFCSESCRLADIKTVSSETSRFSLLRDILSNLASLLMQSLYSRQNESGFGPLTLPWLNNNRVRS